VGKNLNSKPTIKSTALVLVAELQRIKESWLSIMKKEIGFLVKKEIV